MTTILEVKGMEGDALRQPQGAFCQWWYHLRAGYKLHQAMSVNALLFPGGRQWWPPGGFLRAPIQIPNELLTGRLTDHLAL